ncbi:MAG: zinc-binding dehydrogenase [bacterium]|nr:zinc-binding dehydrogenase [bacterium]
MASMCCIVVREHGGYDRLALEQREVPTPAPGEVRVKVGAIGLNHLDTWVRRGVPGHTFPLPLVTSSDASGVVDALGTGTRLADGLREGDPVVVLPGVSCGVCEACQSGLDHLCRNYHILGESCDGTAAEYVCLPAANVAPRPASLSEPEAAAIALVFQTAWNMLVRRAELRAGETVLVHAGLSGVGGAAVQIANALGAQVIATAGGAEKCTRVERLGAHHVIDYQSKDFVKEVRSITGKAGVDVVFEHVGEATFGGSLKCLARCGRVVTCGATTGGDVKLSLHAVFFKSLSILGSTMGSKGDLRRILRMFEQGRFRAVLDRALPMTDVQEAHRLLEAREALGKIVLTV